MPGFFTFSFSPLSPLPKKQKKNKMSIAKQNFATSSEDSINQQINMELQASQVYLSMAGWAQHTSVALPGT
jgi:rubrerythrin